MKEEKSIRKRIKEEAQYNSYFEKLRINPDYISKISIVDREKFPELSVYATSKNIENIKYMPEEVQKEHIDLCEKAVKKVNGIMYYISLDILDEHPEIIEKGVMNDPDSVFDLPQEMIIDSDRLQRMREIVANWQSVEDIPKKELNKNPIYEKLAKEVKKQEETALVVISKRREFAQKIFTKIRKFFKKDNTMDTI